MLLSNLDLLSTSVTLDKVKASFALCSLLHRLTDVFFSKRTKRNCLFRNPPSPLPKGAPPLPVSPLLRRGEKQKVAETVNLLWCFGIRLRP